MNIFLEFDKILKQLQDKNIEYALAGGLAVAFYSIPRFTKDINFLIKRKELGKVKSVLERLGYFEFAKPWQFKNTELTLYRFMKIVNKDEMIIDLLVSDNPVYDMIVDDAECFESEKLGDVKLVSKKDLIAMKQVRNSAQDKADIERLKYES